MNKKYILLGIVTVVAFVGALSTATILKAQTNRTFSQANASTITATDVTARTITVSYVQPLGACSPTYCPSGRSPDVLREGAVMAINAFDQVEDDFTKMKVGDSVTVYFRQDGGASTPYAIKDFTLIPSGCNPITKTCSSSGAITPGGSGSAGSGTGTVTPAKPLPTSIPTSVPTSVPTSIPTSAPTITRDMGVEAWSDQVTTLQIKLQNLGYFPKNLQPTGYFGSITKKAVMDFQAAQGISATGFVGPLTRDALGQ